MNKIILFGLTLLYLFVLVLSMMDPGIDNSLLLVFLTYLFVLPVKNLVLLQGGEVKFEQLASIFGRLNNKYVLNITLLSTLLMAITWLLIFFQIGTHSFLAGLVIVSLTSALAYMFGKYVYTSQVIASYTSEYFDDAGHSAKTSLYLFVFLIPLLVVGFFSDSTAAEVVLFLIGLYMVLKYFGITGGEQREAEVYTILNEELSK